MNVMNMVASQVTTQLQAAECIPVRQDWVTPLKGPIGYLVGNIMGTGPYVAVLVATVAAIALIATLRSENAPRWIKVLMGVFGGLLLLLFIPAIILGFASSVPSC